VVTSREVVTAAVVVIGTIRTTKEAPATASGQQKTEVAMSIAITTKVERAIKEKVTREKKAEEEKAEIRVAMERIQVTLRALAFHPSAIR
jgi:hypothetical protein